MWLQGMTVGLLAMSVLPASAAPEPAFIYESVLDTFFSDDSGLIGFREYDLAFAPEGQLTASVVVVNSENTVVASFPFFPDYRYREGVFARAKVKQPADITLTDPGVYNIVFLVNGEMATRLPVVLEQTSEGDDPFNPVKTYEFFGLWQVFAYLNTREFKDEPHYVVNFWVGGRDLAEGEDKDGFMVYLRRDGEVIGHSKRTLGHINEGHYKRVNSMIFRPHDYKDTPNAPLLPASEWTKAGEYELVVTRKSDDQPIRVYRFTAADGTIVQLPNTELGSEPRIDYLVPRVTDKSTQVYDFEEVIWIRGGAPQAKPAADESEPAGG